MLTRTRIHTWDAIAYAARASGDPLLADHYFSSSLFHPQHLLYAPIAVMAHGALAPFGLARDPFLPLQILNAVLGGCCAWLAGRLAVRLGADRGRALWVVLAVGLSNAVWRYSGEALVMIPSLTFLLLGANLAAGARTRGSWFAAGVAIAGAMLVHQSAVAFALAASVALVIAGSRVPGGAAIAFTLGWMIPAGAAYLAVGIGETHSVSPAALLAWMTSAGHRATSASLSPVAVVRETAVAVAESWVSLNPLRELMHGTGGARAWPTAIATLIGLAGAGAAAVAALPSLARALRAREPVALMLVAGALATALLIMAFQPGNHAYWVFAPAVAGVLNGAFMPPLPSAVRRAVPIVLLAVAAANLVARALPATDPRHAPYADLIAFAGVHFRPGDRLVCGGPDSAIGEGVIALPFFARVPVVLVPRPGRIDDEVRFRELTAEAFADTAQGTRVFATEEALEPLAAIHPRVGAAAIGTLRGVEVYRVIGMPIPSSP